MEVALVFVTAFLALLIVADRIVSAVADYYERYWRADGTQPFRYDCDLVEAPSEGEEVRTYVVPKAYDWNREDESLPF